MHYNLLTTFMLCMLTATTAGCASITKGPTKNISINTTPTEGAECQLTNKAGSWTVEQTPAMVNVHRDNSAMEISCKKGTMAGKQRISYSPEPAAFGNVVMIGGLVGAAIDLKTGAAFSYPDKITIDLTGGPSSDEDTKTSANKQADNSITEKSAILLIGKEKS
ncbi:MAG: hypothetical protein IPP74_07810 [Alphaproteobacteria bacterium]|nr:hypothetical protein [Alphaproteobacteria bacterium]